MSRNIDNRIVIEHFINDRDEISNHMLRYTDGQLRLGQILIAIKDQAGNVILDSAPTKQTLVEMIRVIVKEMTPPEHLIPHYQGLSKSVRQTNVTSIYF